MKRGLNLGCGTRLFTSTPDIQWTNLDITPGPGVDSVGDWRYCLRGRTYDLIVAHQTFEHQGCGEQPIRQCWEIIPPGGSLIVSVPDLRKLAQMWISGELSTQIYMTNVYGPYDGTDASRHRWGFDPDSLHSALHDNVPWSCVKPFDYRPIPGADIARDDRWICAIEAVK